MYKQIFLHELGAAQFRYRLPKLERNAFAFKVYFWDLRKKKKKKEKRREIVIWEVQLCSSVAPGGMLPISGCLWEAGDSPGFIWFLCESGRNESILTITH